MSSWKTRAVTMEPLSARDQMSSMPTTQRKAKGKILIIEDDAAIQEVLSFNLDRDGYDVVVCPDGREGIELASKLAPDLVILDLMLPTIDGIEVCRTLRSEKATKSLPVLMLTAKSEEADQLVGFTVGADDYVTKPFSVKVLMQRIRVLLNRRQQSSETSDTVKMHGIQLDRFGFQVTCNEEPVPLTPTEFRLLEAMMAQPGRAFTRSDLLSSAVGDETIVLERTIDVHIRSLRQKLGGQAKVIETVRGVGYRFAREG